MTTSQKTADFLTDQVSDAGSVRHRKMFGEYALYCNGKVVALICNDKLFVKPTKEGKLFAKNPEEAPPYPGSKPFLVIEEDKWEDRNWMSELIRITAKALPAPKVKKKKR